MTCRYIVLMIVIVPSLQENQLHKVLHVTRMIAARLLQIRDRERALGMYSDAIAATLSLEELKKLEGVSAGKPTYHMIGGACLWYAGWPVVCFGSVCFKDF